MRAVVVIRYAVLQAGLLEGAVALVQEQEIALGVVGHEHVLPAILIEIGDADAHALAGHFADAGLLGDVGELPIAQIVIKPVRHADIAARVAIALAVFGGAADVGLGSPEGVIGDDQVQQAVVVVVEPRGVHAERIRRFAADAGALRDIGKRAVAIIVIERVAAGAANEQVRVPVIIVVAHGHSEIEAQAFARQAGGASHVFEGPVAFVAQQAVVIGRVGFFHLGEFGAVGEEDVHLAILVVVQDADAAAHRLREILTPREIVVSAIAEAGLGRDVGKVRTLGGGAAGAAGGCKPDQAQQEGGGSVAQCAHRRKLDYSLCTRSLLFSTGASEARPGPAECVRG